MLECVDDIGTVSGVGVADHYEIYHREVVWSCAEMVENNFLGVGNRTEHGGHPNRRTLSLP